VYSNAIHFREGGGARLELASLWHVEAAGLGGFLNWRSIRIPLNPIGVAGPISRSALRRADIFSPFASIRGLPRGTGGSWRRGIERKGDNEIQVRIFSR
jgi:hypothetical protein